MEGGAAGAAGAAAAAGAGGGATTISAALADGKILENILEKKPISAPLARLKWSLKLRLV
jgi:hypothetical protein